MFPISDSSTEIVRLKEVKSEMVTVSLDVDEELVDVPVVELEFVVFEVLAEAFDDELLALTVSPTVALTAVIVPAVVAVTVRSARSATRAA